MEVEVWGLAPRKIFLIKLSTTSRMPVTTGKLERVHMKGNDECLCYTSKGVFRCSRGCDLQKFFLRSHLEKWGYTQKHAYNPTSSAQMMRSNYTSLNLQNLRISEGSLFHTRVSSKCKMFITKGHQLSPGVPKMNLVTFGIGRGE